MIKKLYSMLITIFFTSSLFFFSCGSGEDHDHPDTRCLTNSTMFCDTPIVTLKIINLINDECRSDISLGDKVNVFGKTWKKVNFSKPFNQCFTDFKDFSNVENTTQESVLFYLYGDPDLANLTSVDDFLQSQITESALSLEVRSFTKLDDLIKEQCKSQIELGTATIVDDKEWLELTLPYELENCYNSLKNEVLPDEITSLGTHIGIRIDNNTPVAATVEELLNLSFTQSVEGSNL